MATIALLALPSVALAVLGDPIAYTYQRGDWFDVFTVNAAGTDVSELTREGTSSNPSWSSDGSRIAFIRSDRPYDSRAPHHIWMMRADGSNKMRIRTWKRAVTCIDWAPNSKYLAVADYSSPTRRIIRYNIETGATSVLYSRAGAGRVVDLDWSRDGSRIAFTVKDGGSFNSGVLSVASGSVSAAPSSKVSAVAWASQSNDLAMSVRSSSTKSRLRVSSGGSVDTILSTKRIGGLSWAPDDSKLVFDGTISSMTADSGLYTLDADGTGRTKVLGDFRWQYPQFVIRSPEWRPTPTRDAPVLDPDVAETCDYGGPAALSFTLKDESGAPIAGATVRIQSSSDSKKWGTPFDLRTTSAAGTVSAQGEPTRRRYYRAYFAGNGSYGMCLSSIRKVLPEVYLTTPSAPSAVRTGSYFSVSGYLKPRHEAGTYPVRLYCYRLEGGEWVLRRIANAKASDYSTYSRYTATISLPFSGDWRMRAYHRADDLNAETYSGWRYLTVE